MHDKPIIKTIHHAINITSTKVELFAIHCGTNQSIEFPQIKKIIIITDSLHTAKSIFDSSMYLLWNALDINIFLFLLSIFLNFIFFFF